jgi:hypothetical protein
MYRLCSIVVIATVVIAIGCTSAGKEPNASGISGGDQKTTAAKSPSGPKAQTACQLLTASEIAGFLKAPAVTKDELSSGMNEMTRVDFCNWYVKEGGREGIEVRLRRAEWYQGSELLVFSAAKGDAVEHEVERDRAAQPVPGIADEAIYSPYPVGPGGSIALRVGGNAVTITGSPSKDSLVSLAKLAAQRL